MVLMKMCDDDRFDFFGFETELFEQRGRLDKIFTLRPFRRDVVRMVTRIHDYRPVRSVDKPENISDRFVALQIAAHARHDAGAPPVLAHPHHQRVNCMI
jgi:hypothetical protein